MTIQKIVSGEEVVAKKLNDNFEALESDISDLSKSLETTKSSATSSAISTSKAYSDKQDATTLESAKTYAEEYTDGKLTSNNLMAICAPDYSTPVSCTSSDWKTVHDGYLLWQTDASKNYGLRLNGGLIQTNKKYFCALFPVTKGTTIEVGVYDSSKGTLTSGSYGNMTFFYIKGSS